MKYLIAIWFTCATLASVAQVNFVRNPDMEQYSNCPLGGNLINRAIYWSSIIDSASEKEGEYYNTCGNSYADVSLHIPLNVNFYQYPHSGDAFIGLNMYYDKSLPAPPFPLPFDYRDYAQGRLFEHLTAGKNYCVSFWVNMAESSAYGHNKIGAYLDDGSINKLPLPPGSEVTSVVPQVYTNDRITDTARWTKIEGSFVADGSESYISIGIFFPNTLVDTITTNYWLGSYQYSAYLIDDVSVIPIDLPADAGPDNWVEQGKQLQIGRVGDTTAKGLDCKWYHKGLLIDSGAVISVNANSLKNAIDTYIVVQTICGIVKTDTVLVKTTGLGIPLLGGARGGFAIYPNPSRGLLVVKCLDPSFVGMTAVAKIYDLLGRVVHQQKLSFSKQEATIKLNIPNATYLLELQDEAGNVQRERIVVE